MRGKVIYDRKKKKLTGITPACAGKRPITASFSSPSRHHTRVWEELPLAFKSNHGGSPPRVRGKALMLTVSGLPDRITPACAGKSSGPARKRLQNGITPACAGKSYPAKRQFLRGLGSPPRVREKDQKAQAVPRHEDHPRVCGEKATRQYSVPIPIGSPPRVRGKVECLPQYSQQYGITPACAGKRERRTHTFARASGSPPRVRGKD